MEKYESCKKSLLERKYFLSWLRFHFLNSIQWNRARFCVEKNIFKTSGIDFLFVYSSSTRIYEHCPFLSNPKDPHKCQYDFVSTVLLFTVLFFSKIEPL